MLRHLTAIGVVTAFSLTLGARDAAAQVRLAAAGGPSFPLGTLGDIYDIGWHAQLSAGLSFPLPISVRVDAAYNRFTSDAEGNFRVISGTVNGIVSIPSIQVTPYLIGGIGFYSSEVSDVPGSPDFEESDIGANIGAGIRLGLQALSVFAEARLHNVFSQEDDILFVPVSLGIHF